MTEANSAVGKQQSAQSTKVVDVDVRSAHVLALTNTGRVYAWGRGTEGQLGLGNKHDHNSPQRVPLDYKVVSISTGRQHSVVVDSAGKVYTTGCGEDGQLGNVNSKGDALHMTDTFQQVVTLDRSKIVKVVSGSRHTMALSENGSLYAWGGNEFGQTGVAGCGNIVFVPLRVKVLPSDTSGRTSRTSRSSQSPDTSTSTTAVNTAAALPTYFESVHCGFRHCLGITMEGNVYGWGWNYYGQLGVPNRAKGGGKQETPILIGALSPDKLLKYAPPGLTRAQPGDIKVLAASLGGKHSLLVVGNAGMKGSPSVASGHSEAVLGLDSHPKGSISSGTELPRASPVSGSLVSPVMQHSSPRGLSRKDSFCLDIDPSSPTCVTVLLSFGQGDDGQRRRLHKTIPHKVAALHGEKVLAVAAGWCHSAAVTQGSPSSADTRTKDGTRCFVKGDIDAFLGIFINSIIQLMLVTTLCQTALGGTDLAATRILPGIGVTTLLGNSLFCFQANKIRDRDGVRSLTAQPYGINVVLLLSYTLLIMLPVYKQTNDVSQAWQAGLFSCFLTGVIEVVGAFLMTWVRAFIPRAAMLSSIGGISLTFIAMQFAFQVFANPSLALIPLMIILISFGSGVRLPCGVPGVLASVLSGIALAWLSRWLGLGYWPENPEQYSFHVFPPLPTSAVFGALFSTAGWSHISVILPMAIFNLVGNFVNIEAAEAAGDTFPVLSSLLVSGALNVLCPLLGNPFPGCIFIGHPVYKSMGAQTMYGAANGVAVLVLSLVNGGCLVLGLMPMEIAVGILFWVGVVMTSGAFEGGASPTKSFGVAVGVGFVPALAAWALQTITSALEAGGTSIQAVLLHHGFEQKNIPITGIIAMSQGFLMSAIVLSSTMVYIIEREFFKASLWCWVGAAFSMTGMIHAFQVTDKGIANSFGFAAAPTFAFGYMTSALILWFLHFFSSDEEQEAGWWEKVRHFMYSCCGSFTSTKPPAEGKVWTGKRRAESERQNSLAIKDGSMPTPKYGAVSQSIAAVPPMVFSDEGLSEVHSSSSTRHRSSNSSYSAAKETTSLLA
eukprot:CAMPEP_0175126782 /NCGR_PEP_ID=MMETSP0087-20121206/4042_1 /TAXON_ID=136419 /ORGANISM="Unknown Unknown, Strain D1" /LENGTH=1057 /DNA_ID=CAMNT_0016408727 /DNA_START=145 /DNA_END=3320 /DNA_ORIENTATION=+